LLVISFGIGYSILAYFLHKQNQSTLLARDAVFLERDFSTLNKLFHEARFWEKVILSQKNPDADMRFGLLIEQIRNLLVTLKKKESIAGTKSTLRHVIESIDQYETHFNRLLQLKIKQSLLITKMETNYRSMVSIILSSNNPSLLKPLFNITHFLITYRYARDISRYRALKLVINSFDNKLQAAAISDVRMKGYLQSFRDLLDKDFGTEQRIISINENVENINAQLKDYFTIISLESETLFKIKFLETAEIRQELQVIFLLSAILGCIILLVIFLLISKSIITPIRSMARVMQKVKGGNIGARFKSQTKIKDEIIQFGLSFNDMLDTLEANNLKLIDYQKELENKVQELSERELESQRLAAKLQRVEKMEAIGTLAGGVAHDLNNVLSGIVSYPELLLLDLPEDSPIRKPLLTIQQSGQKATAIVQDLLTLARRGVVVNEIVNLNEIICEYLKSPEFDKLTAYNSDIQIKTHLEPDLLNILGSPVHISKTVMNLVSNAAEAISGKGTIKISTDHCHVDKSMADVEQIEEGDYAILKIADNGMGIASKHINSIFEPFYTKKKMGRSGTGLGMAVVWGTVKDHKGYIDVQSYEGKGTTFTLYFPVTRKENMKRIDSCSIQDYMGEGEILIVDDMREQREIAQKLLTKLGYQVITVGSGEEAIEYIENNEVDLIVLDMIMEPGIDGLETYRKILELKPDQKVIIASGYSETARVKEAQRLGAGEYIKKPYVLEKIGIAIMNELKR
jgi:signal transduction histidine kinase